MAISVTPRTRACRFSSASPDSDSCDWNDSTIGAIGTVRTWHPVRSARS